MPPFRFSRPICTGWRIYSEGKRGGVHCFRRFDITVIKQKDAVVEDVLVGGIQRGALLHRVGALLEIALGLVVFSHDAPRFRFIRFQSTR